MMIFTGSVFNLQLRAESRNTEMATAYEAPKYGGTLRVGLGEGAPSTLNPLIDNCPAIFSCLLTYDENCSLQPDLAESYEASENGSNLTFHLYENVSWHDGVEFNASDVKFTFDTIRDDPNLDWIFGNYYAVDINSTEVASAFTVVFNLNEPLGCLPQYLTYVPIIPKHIYEGTNLTTNPANENPIGTGPFKFESWAQKTNLTVTANEQYFRGRPYLDSIFYRWDITPQSELTVALENNIIDVVAVKVDPSKIQDLEKTTGTSVAAKEATEYHSIWLNLSNPILQNRNVRQAIAHAINKTKIVTEAFYGYTSVAKGPLPPSLKEWCNPNITDYRLNKTLAEELLDQEYPRGPDGWRFNLTIKTYRDLGVTWDANALYIIRDDLKSIGINASIQFSTPINQLLSGNFDAFYLGWAFDALGPDELYDLFHSGQRNNFNRYSNATLDIMLEEARSSLNDTLRKIDFDRAQEIIAENLPQVFLYHMYSAVAYNNDFHGRISNPPVNNQLPITSYFLESTWYDKTLSGKGNCPYRIRFIDFENRTTGYRDGNSLEQIPDSTYSGADSDPQLAKIRLDTGNYTVELEGTENGTYSFELVNLALDYKHVSIVKGTIQTGQIKQYFVSVYPNSSMQVSSTLPIDVYSDGKIDIRDVSNVAKLFGMNYPNMKYNPICDIVFDWKIDIRDVSLVAKHFGDHYP